MRTSEQIAELTAALAEASKEFPAIERGCMARVPTKKGGEYTYSYADLDDVLSAVREPLAKNGLVISHDCVVVKEQITVDGATAWSYAVETTARIDHKSGQWKESSPLLVPCDGSMAAAQLIGSGNTYGKRYTTQNILGLSTEADDDANAAGGTGGSAGRKEPMPECPSCHKNDFVLKDREGPGWFCWKNQAKGKLGCGHKWQPAQPEPELPVSSYSPPETKPKKKAEKETNPELTPEEIKYVADASQTIIDAPTLDALKSIGEILKTKSEPVKESLRGIFQSRMKVLEGLSASSKPETSAA